MYRRESLMSGGAIGSAHVKVARSGLARQEALAADEPVVPGAARPSEYWNRLKAAQRERMRRPV